MGFGHIHTTEKQENEVDPYVKIIWGWDYLLEES